MQLMEHLIVARTELRMARNTLDQNALSENLSRSKEMETVAAAAYVLTQIDLAISMLDSSKFLKSCDDLYYWSKAFD